MGMEWECFSADTTWNAAPSTAAFQELDTNLTQKEEIKTKYLLLQMSELSHHLLALADIKVCGCKIPIRSALCYVYSHLKVFFFKKTSFSTTSASD